MSMSAETKARLIAIGGVRIDPSILPESPTSTSGPGAGMRSFFLRSGDKRVQLGVKDDSEYCALDDNGELVIADSSGNEIARGRIEPAISHCPEQVYVTVSERCVFDCKFCAVPLMQGRIKSTEEIVSMVEKVLDNPNLSAISITSGIADTPEKEVDRVVEVVKAVSKYGLPIGVSVYPAPGSPEKLFSSGATEVKYNVETMDREIFKRVCPDSDLEFVLSALGDAVDVFAPNRVFSNLLVGLGETDDSIKQGVEYLASMGVIPNLRAASPHPLREKDFHIKRPGAERLLSLARYEREILDEYGLRGDVSCTMCLRCMGCDLVPHRDL